MKISNSTVQFIKFGIVGIFNTLITAITIWVFLMIFHFSDYLSNIIGYILGLANSFIWNRKWTFANSLSIKETLLKFIVTFVVSYLLQLGNLYLLLHFTHIDSYVCQLLSIVFYTLINFSLNKYYTFKS